MGCNKCTPFQVGHNDLCSWHSELKEQDAERLRQKTSEVVRKPGVILVYDIQVSSTTSKGWWWYERKRDGWAGSTLI